MTTTPYPFAEVPRLFPGGTIACLATGPSLCAADVSLVRRSVDGVVAISDAVKLASDADVLYSCDAKWWKWHVGCPQFSGLKYSLSKPASQWPGVQILKNTGDKGLEHDPGGLRTGKNSGYQAINLAVHLGASRIVLLGYDMHGDHFFGSHRDKSVPPFDMCLKLFASIVEPLQRAGVLVLNATSGSKLAVFPRVALRDAVLRQAS